MIADRISTIARNTIIRKTKYSCPSTMPQIQDRGGVRYKKWLFRNVLDREN